ncbi:hypothetical protein NDU88_003237 [Pleurodeles waltl]|uniref:Uncharacterized protein n=1 Tax=Pleurodeles waltl TaxID=8319 RepID=A0AAV7RG86_PLEWA|nr:hypothetical protein NDU88_003237 [Pleurodeles waltl]
MSASSFGSVHEERFISEFAPAWAQVNTSVTRCGPPFSDMGVVARSWGTTSADERAPSGAPSAQAGPCFGALMSTAQATTLRDAYFPWTRRRPKTAAIRTGERRLLPGGGLSFMPSNQEACLRCARSD